MQADYFEGSFSFTAWNPLSLSWALGFVRLRSASFGSLDVFADHLCLRASVYTSSQTLVSWDASLCVSNYSSHFKFVSACTVHRCSPLLGWTPYIALHSLALVSTLVSTASCDKSDARIYSRIPIPISAHHSFCCNSTFALQKNHEYSPHSKTTVWRIASMWNNLKSLLLGVNHSWCKDIAAGPRHLGVKELWCKM